MEGIKMQLVRHLVIVALFLSVGADNLYAKLQKPEHKKAKISEKAIAPKKAEKVAKENKVVKPKMKVAKVDKKAIKVAKDRSPASVKAKKHKKNKKKK
jgi:hypothetical protein